MKRYLGRELIAIALVISTASLPSLGKERRQDARTTVQRAAVDNILSTWGATPQKVAQQMMDKYGAPNEATATMLVWHNTGPWKRTIVFRDEVPHDFPMPHTDLLQQFLDYRVPPKKFSVLAEYDGSVIAERTKGEISARCDKEEMNFLAINLAHDIVMGKRNIKEAREFYASTAMAFKNGERPPYTQGLVFSAGRGGTADPDRPMNMK